MEVWNLRVSSNIYNELKLQLIEHKNNTNLPIANIRSQITNLLPLLIALVEKEKVSILDYGGSAGETYIDCINKLKINNIVDSIADQSRSVIVNRASYKDDMSSYTMTKNYKKNAKNAQKYNMFAKKMSQIATDLLSWVQKCRKLRRIVCPELKNCMNCIAFCALSSTML